MNRSRLIYGKDADDCPLQLLRAGALSLAFDPQWGFVRYIKHGEEEIVRAVYGAVRNERWETLWPRITDVKVVTGSESFLITFSARVEQQGVFFEWQSQMEGTSDGVVRIRFDGFAGSCFRKNRIGLCLLLPLPDYCERLVWIGHGDGGRESYRLPAAVAPHQPVKDVRRLGGSLRCGGEFEITFEGETFEMEDQRNWGDASLKVYSTPIEEGWPKRIESGTRVKHEITMRVWGGQPALTVGFHDGLDVARINQVTVQHERPLGRLNLGVTLTGAMIGQHVDVVQRLGPLKLGHVRLNLDLADADQEAMRRAAVRFAEGRRVAGLLDASLLICVRVGAKAVNELGSFISSCRSLGGDSFDMGRRGRWGVFQKHRPVTPSDACEWVGRLVGEFGGMSIFVGGSDEHLAELNRNRPDGWQRGGAWMNFPWNPQSHLLDLNSMFENLAAIETCLASASAFTDGWITLSPIRLRADPDRWSRARATSTAGVDPRQVGLITAAWTVGLLGGLCRLKNLELATVFDACGDAGLMGDGSDSDPDAGLVWSEAMSRSAWVYPVYQVFREFGRGRRFFSLKISEPMELAAFAFEDDSGRLGVIVASLIDRPQRVEIRGCGLSGKVRYLDERNVIELMRDPESFGAARPELLGAADGGWVLNLLPYSIATLA